MTLKLILYFLLNKKVVHTINFDLTVTLVISHWC